MPNPRETLLEAAGLPRLTESLITHLLFQPMAVDDLTQRRLTVKALTLEGYRIRSVSDVMGIPYGTVRNDANASLHEACLEALESLRAEVRVWKSRQGALTRFDSSSLRSDLEAKLAEARSAVAALEVALHHLPPSPSAGPS